MDNPTRYRCMGLDVSDIKGEGAKKRDAANTLTHQRLLARAHWAQFWPMLAPILITGPNQRTTASTDHSSQSITSPLEHHPTRALSLRTLTIDSIKGLALPIRPTNSPNREHAMLFSGLSYQVGRPAGQRAVRFFGGGAGLWKTPTVHRHQGGGTKARRVDHHAGTRTPRKIRQPTRGEIRRIPKKRHIRVRYPLAEFCPAKVNA